MWPFDASVESLWLALYLLTFALHAVFVSYVAAGTVYTLVAAVRRRGDPIAARTRDWLPFMLGAGITAGVGPLLFIQLLYQRRFYTANLLLGPRWGAVVPALIIGFYALYLAKASEHRRRVALAIGALCFAFVAWSWTEVHQLMLADPAWAALYGGGTRVYLDPAIAPRLALWLGAMLALYAATAAWSASLDERRTLARLGLLGLLVATAAGLAQGFAPAHGWTYVLLAATAATATGWLLILRRRAALPLVTAGTLIALLTGTIVREAPRLALIEHDRATATHSGGLVVFLATFAAGALLIRWVIKTVRAL